MFLKFFAHDIRLKLLVTTFVCGKSLLVSELYCVVPLLTWTCTMLQHTKRAVCVESELWDRYAVIQTNLSRPLESLNLFQVVLS